MANLTVTRTYVGSIQNYRQVSDGLDSLGDSASKIWNVARWTAGRIWDVTGEIPDEGVLKSCMKNRSCWKDLNAQSSQKVIEELSDWIARSSLSSTTGSSYTISTRPRQGFRRSHPRFGRLSNVRRSRFSRRNPRANPDHQTPADGSG